MKKTLAIVLSLCMLFALVVPAMASAKLPAASEGFAFHCNDIEGGGNGRTYIVGKDKDFGKFDKKTGEGLIQLAPAPGDTTGKVWVINGYNYDDSYSGEWVCTTCGRTDWVSFSNKSGVPDGKNIQLQHPGPSKRWINIKVIYNLDVPECEFECKNADAKCNFVCTCLENVCANLARFGAHACTFDLECGEGHDCPFDDADLTCKTVCDCEAKVSETIVDQKVLINIADGYIFRHRAPRNWNGGAYDSGPRFIFEKLFSSKTYNVFYVGAGDCACDCDSVVCDAACKVTPCNYEPPTHEHTAVCDNCKNGQGSNHGNHEGLNPENNTNYFCLDCGIKLGSYNKNQGWRDANNDPGDPIVCQCPVCTGHDD